MENHTCLVSPAPTIYPNLGTGNKVLFFPQPHQFDPNSAVMFVSPILAREQTVTHGFCVTSAVCHIYKQYRRLLSHATHTLWSIRCEIEGGGICDIQMESRSRFNELDGRKAGAQSGRTTRTRTSHYIVWPRVTSPTGKTPVSSDLLTHKGRAKQSKPYIRDSIA